MTKPRPWPLWNLTLRTPRLELRPDDDAGLGELAEEARHGVYEPGDAPFPIAWPEKPETEMVRNLHQYHWSKRAEIKPSYWALHFLVRLEGRVIGSQCLGARDFAITRTVHTSSWIGLRHQGRGMGTEMRAAVLMFAFDHLGAEEARSTSFQDNPASLSVSRKLGYVQDGTERLTRESGMVETARLLVTPERFARPDWTAEVRGFEECRDLLVG